MRRQRRTLTPTLPPPPPLPRSRCGVKAEAVAFLFRDSQITDERFLVFMNDLLSSGGLGLGLDLLSSGNIPGL